MTKSHIRPILKKLSPDGYSATLDKCRKRMEEQKKTVIFTPNSDMIYNAQTSNEIRRVILSADILFPDGMGVYMGMKLFGLNPFERTCGIELAEKISADPSFRKYNFFLLGAQKGVAEKAAHDLISIHKGLCICGCHHGYFDKNGKENDEVVERINRTRADILFVCLGFPEQEKWILQNLPKLNTVKLAIGLGGSLDVWSGNTKRSPKFISAVGLEWLWRVIFAPQKLPKVPNLFKFAFFTLKEGILKQ